MDSLARDPRSRLAGGAYWAMMRRIVVIAGCIDAAWLLLYTLLGALPLAGLNVVSVAMYFAAYIFIGQRRNKLAVTLIWAEVLAHSAIGSLLIGWDSGFHYFLLMFIPAIVVGSSPRVAMPLVGLLLAFYVGLDALCAHLGPLTPLPAPQLQIARWVNIVLVFAMFYAVVGYYRATVVAAERRLLQMATTDPLTGLANRSQFHVRAMTEIARCRRGRQPVSLVLADVDFFKGINDQHGHEAGDKVLMRLADLMRNTLRETDVLARWGGEEFIALLPDSDEACAVGLAERVRHAVATVHIDVGGRTVSVTMSLGVAACDSADDLQAAIARADLALYASKRGGRDCVSVASGVASPGPIPEAAFV
jgi:diguanylate cyclase (GGDEF)-like protein